MSNSNRKKAKLAIVFVSTIGLVGGVNADSITDQVEAAKRQSLKQSEENQARLAKEDAAAWAKKKAVMDEEAKAAIEKHEAVLKAKQEEIANSPHQVESDRTRAMIINGETCPLKYEINTKIPDTPKRLSRDEMLDTQMQDIKDQIRSAARDMGIVTNNLIATCKRIPEYTPSASNSANTANFQAGKMCEYRVREEVKRLDQERSAKTMKLNAEYDRLGALLSDEWFNKMNQEEQIADEKVLINSGRSAACYECEKQAIKLNLTAGCVCEVRAQVSGHGIVTTCEPK